LKIDKNNLEDILFEYIDQIKVLISPDTWENILLDCSKNELLILLLLYRKTNVNMTQIAEYIEVPLNTATGIVARMEKKQMVCRERGKEDKRVVTIELADCGKELMQNILKEFIYYGQKLLEALSIREIETAGNVLDKMAAIFKEEKAAKTNVQMRKVKRITIE